MSKERLEEIKEEVELLRGDMHVSSIEVDTSADVILDDMDWLIEQAEQFQELEGEYEYLESIIDRVYFDKEQERSLARELDRQNEQRIKVINKLYERLHELEDVIIKDARGYEISRLQTQNKHYREAFHKIRRIDNDPDVNYCEFASLVKDIVDESLKNG